jgi:hypothetical protein
MPSAKLALAAAGAVAAAAVCLSPVAANAAATAPTSTQAPQGCPGGFHYYAWNGHHYFLVKPGGKYSVAGSAGITLHMTIGTGTLVGTQVQKTWGTSTGFSAVGVSVAAHSDISNQIQNQVTNSVTLQGDYTVKKYAVLSYGAWGYEYDWEMGSLTPAPPNGHCVFHLKAKGTAKSPAQTPGFHVSGS